MAEYVVLFPYCFLPPLDFDKTVEKWYKDRGIKSVGGALKVCYSVLSIPFSLWDSKPFVHIKEFCSEILKVQSSSSNFLLIVMSGEVMLLVGEYFVEICAS